jgi:ATP-dependent Clp protease ATP-binding subunit ClpA
VIFSPLTQDEVKQIAQLYLAAVHRQMTRQGKRLTITEAAINRLVDQGFSPAYGARFLKRTIDEKVKLQITNMWKAFTGFVVDVVDGEVDVRGE